MKHTKIKRTLITVSFFIIIVISWIIWGNSTLTVNEIVFSSSAIPESFSGFRIVQISDLHNTKFGKDNLKLLSEIEKSEPDIIIITGDLVDSRHTDIYIGIDFASKACKIAPTYYVSGNHEARISEYLEFEKALIDSGVRVLKNESVQIKKDEDSIFVHGIIDPNFLSAVNYDEAVSDSLQKIDLNDSFFNILMAHHPEFFDKYVSHSFDLVFSGHAHGGQIRLPFIGGIFAPGQGFFPEYDSGVFTESNTSMIVSRGIGNSLFPFRVNNRPEIIVTELNKTEVQQ